MLSSSLPDEVRAACAWVAERAQSVRLDASRIEAYAGELVAPQEARQPLAVDPESAAAFAVCMNAINFGSGWWPTIRKREGHSGFATMEAGVKEHFAEKGSWSVEELTGMTPQAIAAVVRQDPGHPLMGQFALALRDVGRRLRDDFSSSFLGPVEQAETLAGLAAVFAGWDSFADVSTYAGRPVPFFKRAQLAAADLQRAGVAALPGRERLTAFADNLVPHVLRVDGVLRLDPGLVAKIEGGELLPHGSPEEVELRAGAVHAVELFAAGSPFDLTPAEIDELLWNRGREPRYKALPRPRSRNTAY